MRNTGYLALALLAAATIVDGPAFANTCQTDTMTCATNMPIDGYCECTSRGNTEGGTVVSKPVSRRPANAKTGGCGANPSAPGCR
jgi:hypothetical protein